MPYRKTRKQNKKQNQRGGAGIFSLFPKAAPLPFESYLSAINRVYTFIYSKVDPSTPGYIPLKPGQTLLTVEQKEFFRSLVESYKKANSNSYHDEEFVKKFLGVNSIHTLTKEIQDIESVNKEIRDIVLNRPAIAQSYVGSWGRLLPVIFSSEKHLNYRQNWEQHLCRFVRGINQNKPIRSLEEKRCIVLYHDKSDLSIVESQLQMVYGDKETIGPAFPLVMVDSEFMPVMNDAPFPYTMIEASKLMKTSYFLDALIANGVKEIQTNLAETIEREHKRLWNQYSLIKVVNHSNLRNHDVYMQKFISVTDDFLISAGTYFSLSNLMSLDMVRGMDVQSSVQMRTRYSSIWSTLGKDPNLPFFQGLKYIEQIEFAVLQFKHYMKMVATNPNTAFQSVYLTDLRDPAKKEIFLENIEAESKESYRKLLNRHT